jgi:hypothetical protein
VLEVIYPPGTKDPYDMYNSRANLAKESFTKGMHEVEAWPTLHVWPSGNLALNVWSSNVYLYLDTNKWLEKPYSALQDLKASEVYKTLEGPEVWAYLHERFGALS